MPTVDMLFEGLPFTGQPIGLLFGGFGGAAPPPASVAFSQVVRAPVFSGAAVYDNRVTRWAENRALCAHQVAQPTGRSNAQGWGVSRKELGGTVSHWQTAVTAQVNARVPFKQNVRRGAAVADNWRLADRMDASSSGLWQSATSLAAQRADAWQLAVRRGADVSSRMEAATRRTASLLAAWQRAVAFERNAGSRINASRRYSAVQDVLMWQHGRFAPNGRSPWPLAGLPLPNQWVPDTNLLFQCPPLAAPWVLLFGDKPCYTNPLAQLIIPVRRIYMVINSASLRRVDGNIMLPASSMSLGIEADSWAWSFSAALPGSALADLEPSASGVPVEVEALVNGVPYRALVERVSREREFGKSDIRVSGRGKTALLDSPYAPVQSFNNVSARTAQQLMGDVLTVNGEPLDWAVNFGLEDWLVPTGVFTHQGSYIAALNAIANAAGGYIQPHPSLKAINVLPRYPVAPWDWGSVVPDFELPSDVTTRESIEWLEKARYNRVFVSGQGSGVLAQVTRAGTAGDIVAPMITDALITTAGAARQRGIAILADTGRQVEVTLRLPVLAETGVITPGKFVKYTDGGASRLGIVRSTGVEIGMPEIWQTLGVLTYA